MNEDALKHEQKEAQERREEFVNVGEPPITGRVEKGSEMRKKMCEDVKINDPEKGLFMVADGVSMSEGWFASRQTGATVQEILGQSLDEQLENITHSTQIPVEKQTNLIKQLVQAEIKRAVLEADQRIKTRAKSATTLSLARLVEMPDTKQYLFVTNVGDSRIFVMRQGKLIRLTEDDNWLTEALRRNSITEEDARLADQAEGVDGLPDHLRIFYQNRNRVTRAVGGLKDEDVSVKRYELLPGDRLVLASDGLTDQMKENRISKMLAGQPDDRAAERELQTTADKIALDNTEPRAKADDIAVVVRTIGKRGPDRSYLRKEAQTKTVSEEEISAQDVAAWRRQMVVLERELQSNLDPQKKRELTRLQYWVARMDLKDVQERVAPRFEKGDKVRIRRPDMESGFDPNKWTIGGYDEAEDRYIVSHPSRTKHQTVERYTLELWQAGDLVQAGDQIEMPTPDAKGKTVYTVAGENKGLTVLTRDLPEGMERRVENPEAVEAAMRKQLARARVLKREMERAEKRFLDKQG